MQTGPRLSPENIRRFAIGFALAAALLAPAIALAQSPVPAALGLQVEKPAGDGELFSQGSGVLVGDGLVLTAAHVIEINPQDPKVRVYLDGQRVEGDVAYSGRDEQLDLALIKVDPATLPADKQAANLTVCRQDAGPSEQVVVDWMGKSTRETTILRADPPKDPADRTPRSTMLAGGHPQGASGGGVFDPESGCLLGIIIAYGTFKNDIPGVPHEVTVFLPASRVSTFLAEHRGR